MADKKYSLFDIRMLLSVNIKKNAEERDIPSVPLLIWYAINKNIDHINHPGEVSVSKATKRNEILREAQNISKFILRICQKLNSMKKYAKGIM